MLFSFFFIPFIFIGFVGHIFPFYKIECLHTLIKVKIEDHTSKTDIKLL